MTITFALSHQIISRMDSMILASGSKNYVTAKFDLLTEDWTAPITAIFDSYTVVLDEDNQCLVPWEVLANPGKVAVSAFCGDLHTATSVLVPVHPSGYVAGETPQPPTPDVYQQLIDIAKNAENVANSVREDANAGAFNGKDGEPGPQGIPGEQGPAGPEGKTGPQGPAGQDAPQIDDTQASPDHPWSGEKVATELGKYAPMESALTISGIGSDMASLSPTIAWKMQGLKLFGRTTQDGTPKPETPVPLVSAGDSGYIVVAVSGKNLLIDDISGAYYGDGTTKEYDSQIRIVGGFLPNTRYTLSLGFTTKDIVKTEAARLLYFRVLYTDMSESYHGFWDDGSTSAAFTTDLGKTVSRIFLTRHSRWTSGTITITYSQIEIGTMATTYEPHTEQNVTISTPNGLPGLPVSSGGNYIDSTGQQWLCDEIDFVRGVYVQRIKERELTGNEGFVTESDGISYYFDYYNIAPPPSGFPAASVLPGLCTHYTYIPSTDRTNGYHYYHAGYSVYLYRHMFTDESVSNVSEFKTKLNDLHTAGNSVIVFDLLTTPVETALAEEDLKAYAALTSYNGITNVIAQGCGVGATALANPNAYINGLIQRISALEQNAIGG